jgi:hypothetical protein
MVMYHQSSSPQHGHIMDPEEKARRMLAKADTILASVDESFIITSEQSGHIVRLMPAFRPEEITLGPVLGRGGFGVVHEIAKFTLDQDDDVEEGDDDNNNNNNNGEQQAYGTSAGETTEQCSSSSCSGMATTTMMRQRRLPPPPPTIDDHSTTEMSDHHDVHVHYDIREARRYMTRRCQRQGTARYALKLLHDDLSPVERARGMIDLAVEAKYLSVVWHPNISTLLFFNFFFLLAWSMGEYR